MITLRIEHAITDFGTWFTAFSGFAEIRANAGVRSERIYQPVGNDHSLTLDLDFDDEATAAQFEQFLRANVWSSPAASPALAGDVKTELLVLCPPS